LSFEEDTYSSIFTALKHPIRRRILRMLGQSPVTYTDILNQLNIDNGLLNYHLDNMKELITKDKEGGYVLSEFGKAALSLTTKVEEPVSKQGDRIFGLNTTQIKSVLTLLIICVGALAVLYVDLNNRYMGIETQYSSLKLTYDKEHARAKNWGAEIVYETLWIALVEEKIPDHNLLTRNTSTVVLSTELIEDVDVPEWVGSFRILLLSPDQIKAKTDVEGDFLYLLFKKFDLNPENILVSINTVGIFDTGGGMIIQFKLVGKIYQWWIA